MRSTRANPKAQIPNPKPQAGRRSRWWVQGQGIRNCGRSARSRISRRPTWCSTTRSWTPRALRRFTKAQCFCVGKRAGRESVRQETIHRLMIRAAAPGQACRSARRAATRSCSDAAPRRRSRWRWPAFAFEVVPGVSSAIAAPELAGIPVTHRGSASGFLVLSGHATDAFENGLQGRSAQSAVSLVVLMGLGSRHELAETLMARGWNAARRRLRSSVVRRRRTSGCGPAPSRSSGRMNRRPASRVSWWLVTSFAFANARREYRGSRR